MPRAGARGLAIVAFLFLAILPGASQDPTLTILTASPDGDLTALADASQIRILFSEPMVPLGTVLSGAAPPWIRITPAVAGSFFWSGTKTLIFSPDGSAPLPYATRFTVRVDGSAASVAGRSLGAPYELTFTTPTVQLLSAEWYRQTGRFDSPAVIALRFNQPVRPEDAAAHAHVALTPHAWNAPALTPEIRERWRQADPAGLARFDDKVTAVRAVTARSDALRVRVARSWNEERFPPEPTRVVLETIDAPPPEGWLTITIDHTMPSPEGRETRPAHSAVVHMEPAFFVARISCTVWCEATNGNPIHLTYPVEPAALRSAMSVADVTDGKNDRPVFPARSMPAERAGTVDQNPTLGGLGFDPQPAGTTWKLRLDATLMAADGQTLGYPWVGFVETVLGQGFVTLDGAVWDAGAGPVPVHARNVTSMTQWIVPVPLSLVMPRLRALHRGSTLWPAARGERRTLSVTPDAVQVHDLDLRRRLTPSGTGIFWAKVAPAGVLSLSVPPEGSAPRGTLLQVTNLGVSVKDSPQSTLVFVTRLDTGVPVPDARIAIVDTANRTRWRGTTDRDGVALAPALRLPGRRSELSFIVTAEKDGDAAFVGSNWTRDLNLSRTHSYYEVDESGAVLRGSVFTDRGVYREMEEIHIKAVVRDDTPGGMRLVPAGRPLDAVVFDARGKEADRRTITVSEWSSAEWTWRVPDGSPLGRYSVVLTRAGTKASNRTASVASTFLVAAFRRPDFRVDAALTADPAVLGSTLQGTVAAKYLFGGALGTRPVRWWFSREPVQAPPPAIRERYPEDRYAVGYLPRDGGRSSGDVARSKEDETLADDGRSTVRLPTSSEDGIAYSYVFEGDVEDVSGQHIANRAALVVHPASFYLAMSRLPVFVGTKTAASAGVAAVDLSGRTVTDVPVTVSLVREEWGSVPPTSRWSEPRWERREIPAGEWTVRTAAGETAVPIALREGGSYVLRATARDASGRQARTELGFYSLGPGVSSWRKVGNRIDLSPEREAWKPGETARILVHSPWPRATGLVTVEREGIRSHRTVTLTSTQDIVEVPITEADVPNVFVSVMLVKGRTSTDPTADDGQPSFRIGYTELSVDDSSKGLRVAVTADREEYRPGQPVTVSVSVAARDGKPAASEVTLWAIDYGLLSLTKYTTPDVLKAIYVPKALQVTTGDNRQLFMSRRPIAAPAGGVEGGVAGGGFGGVVAPSPVLNAQMATIQESQPASQGIEVRQDFRPLVFWLGSATTGANGRATTTVTLPDSLTTYRIMAVAGDQASRFGFAEREIRATKPLTLLPAFPRFLSTGDRASFGAVLTNSGTDAGNAVVTIESLDPGTLQFGTRTTRTVPIAPGTSESVSFDALAKGAGSSRVRISAALGAETDTFEMPLLVTEPLRPETTAAYGDTTGTATERIALPPGVLPGVGGLTVDLSSTALVGLGEAVRYLDEYPYGCAEQKASRAHALLLASDLGGAFTLSGKTAGHYRAAGTAALNALYSHQCESGGFSLWPGQCNTESAYLTAYVLHVMKVAGTLRVPLKSAAVEDALDYLEREVRDAPPAIEQWPVWAAAQAFSVKVLAEFGREPAAEIARLVGLADRLPVFALSYLADALAASNDRGPRYQDVVRRLTNAIRIDADRAHVEEIDDDALSWVWNSNVRATAVVLDGLSRRKDNAALVAPLARWLLAARTNVRWDTTHENAMALEALVAYYRAFESGVPRMTTTVTVGSAVVGTEAFSGRSTTARRLQVPMEDLLTQSAVTASPVLSIASTGTGRVYYTARLQSFAPEAPEAVDRGFQVERHYEPYKEDGTSPAGTLFRAGDLVRVRLTVTIRGEGRYLALTDPVPAGFEPVDAWFETTARALSREDSGDAEDWPRGTFDYVERHDDRVQAFATRLASGRHEFTYLVRATTPGTFQAPGARVEAMYAPELGGRSQAATVTVKLQRN